VNLLIVSSEFPPGPGGIGAHTHHLADQLCGLGWQVSVLAPQHYASAEEVRRFNESQAYSIQTFPRVPTAPLKAVQRYSAIARHLRQASPDVVIASGTRAVWVTSAAIGSASIPWVAIGHGSEFTLVTGWERALVRRTYDRASAIISVSRFTLGLVLACGIRPAASHVIPNGADDKFFRILPESVVAATRRRLGFGDDPLLLTVGNVTERKGQEVVIRAMPEILRRHPRARYLIAGLPTDRAKLESIARELGVEDRVHFLGRQPYDEIRCLMNAADLFLMTSRSTSTGDCEGFGIAVIEAALCGTPAIVSRGSGLSEAVADMETGMIVPEGDSAGVADAVCRMLGDDAFRAGLAKRARERALDGYTWTEVISRYDAVLRELAGVGARPGAEARSA
jgi:phosphatidylinositol alpha-1,6-mannosyltransferase